MNEYVWKHLPYAIYLDTNVLRTAGPKLEAFWINELLSITTKLSISLCISELVLAEWCEHIAKVLEANRRKLFSSKALLEHYGISIPDIKPEAVSLPEKARLVDVVSNKLKRAGFDVIPNWDAPLSKLLTEAVAKKPPFEEGGKGLCDAVILESYVQHAKKGLTGGRVLVVSNDTAVKRSEDRFKDRGLVVDFMDEHDIVEKLKSLFNDELAARIEGEKKRLRDYVLPYEADILDFVKRTPLEITDWMLNAPSLGREKDPIYGTIESILSVRPTKITHVTGGAPMYGVEPLEGRYPVRVSVGLELDFVVTESGFGISPFGQTRAIVTPDLLESSSPVPLARTATDWRPREITRKIGRELSVLVTLDAEKEKMGDLDDFRIEKII